MKEFTCLLGYDDFDVWTNGDITIAIEFNEEDEKSPIVYKVKEVNESEKYDLSGEEFFSDKMLYFQTLEDKLDPFFQFIKKIDENKEGWINNEYKIVIEYEGDTTEVKQVRKVYGK